MFEFSAFCGIRKRSSNFNKYNLTVDFDDEKNVSIETVSTNLKIKRCLLNNIP